VTIAQFGEQLKLFAPGYVHGFQVFDATNLPGSWDFTLGWSSADQLRPVAGGTPPAAGDLPAPSDPSGAISLPDALTKQLGLKLVQQKRPMPVLVIDHVEQKPTEN
jgi:uncharacterized protein (TIGR03435 family)